MPPIIVAGRCKLEEIDTATRVFALCKEQAATTLVPVSLPAESYGRAVISSNDGKVLFFRTNQFPTKLDRIYLGVSVPQGRTLAGQICTLQWTLDSGDKRRERLRLLNVGAFRYALLAVLRPVERQWQFEALRDPRYYASRRDLAQSHHVPTWWSNRA